MVRWSVALILAAGAFLLGNLFPVATGLLYGHVPGLGPFAIPMEAHAWGVSGEAHSDPLPWYGFDAPTLAHSAAFTLWWVALVVAAGSFIQGIEAPHRRMLQTAAAALLATSLGLHLWGMHAWTTGTEPGLGFVLQAGAALGLVAHAWFEADAPPDAAP